jgi:hypothetical protein
MEVELQAAVVLITEKPTSTMNSFDFVYSLIPHDSIVRAAFF